MRVVSQRPPHLQRHDGVGLVGKAHSLSADREIFGDWPLNHLYEFPRIRFINRHYHLRNV